MKIFVTEYEDGRKCVAIGESEERASILTEDISDGEFYHVDGEVPEGVSVLDPFCDEDISDLVGVLEPVGDAVDLYDPDWRLAKGVLVRCPLDTGVYEWRDGRAVLLDE